MADHDESALIQDENEEPEHDPNIEQFKEQYDPASVLMNILDKERTQRHLHLQQQYWREKSDLIEQIVPVVTRLYYQDWRVLDGIYKIDENDKKVSTKTLG